MKYSASLFVASAVAVAARPKDAPTPGPDGRYTLEAPGIRAQFIPYAATLTNLFVKDKSGVERDIVLGYDNASYYPVDPGHPVYNAVPGRYTNRIGGGQFTLDNVTYNIPKNDGPNTLHSGPNNWSFREWNVTAVSKDSITFSIYDPANSTGMPGHVESTVTYSLEKNRWKIRMEASSPDVRTPIMLTQHTYFNLDAFANPDTQTIWNHTMYMPKSHRTLAIDANALPTGKIVNITKNSVDDFWSAPHQLGYASGNADFQNHCGNTCNGYNGEYILDDNKTDRDVVVSLSSEWNGIKADLRTNQAGIVLYSCYWNDGTAPMKSTQGVKGGSKLIPKDGCIAIEAMDYVDGINHPEWGRLNKQIFGPGQKYVWEASWQFGLIGKSRPHHSQ
ncbi:aldose 1-epimerase [Delitschia confertaspora ATCC 74209]|uniref:Aldose 1-epimerase n=1 Tax=Delitschia confertaspora ATCC 74209 TaxID=1513339 RepID=A0A9P4JUY7_9PLEO|nr:aldose 1-epimerase [Delitschia confertaspora ATCC 74209]